MPITSPLSVRRALPLLLLLSALPLPALAQAGKDTIRLKDGKDQTVKIDAEEYGGVTFTPARGAAATAPWKDVQSIQYGGAPEFAQASAAFAAGRLAEAQTQFEELAADAKLRPVLKQHALYHLALIHLRLGRLEEAIAAHENLLRAFPKGRYLLLAGGNLLACHLAKKDVEGAGRALERFTQDVRGAGLEGGFEAELGLLKARLLEAQKKFAEARAVYEVAEKTGASSPAVAQEARLGVGRCLLREGKGADAEPIFRGLKDLPDAGTRVSAGAWNGIGDIVAQEGREKRDPEKLLEALYAYLRGVVQYRPAPGEPTEEYERALAGAADCFKFISQLDRNPERKRQYADRSRERLEQLKKEFPSSPYLEGR
ncbi:MAG TPA: tetratricopeptide repeat protein [Planctomycetota bacterium]|jgi:TolA-binding protein|nr:tetratricopeptide repeat protein [Planctomycetota bacterium]